MPAKASGRTYVAYLITWTESEAGWGCRPDGASLHLTQEHVKTYLKEYWDRMPKEVPHEYSRNDSGTGKMVAVSKKLYDQLKSKGSIRFWQTEMRELRAKGDIVEG